MIEIKHKTTGEVLHRVDADSLQSADLRYADLRGADLRYANLCGAYLRYADLRGADLYGANLRYTIYDTKPEREELVQELLDAIDADPPAMGEDWKQEVLKAREALK